jgi:lipoprotein-releasing system permease protein
MAHDRPDLDRDRLRLRGWIDVGVGLTLIAIGAIVLAVANDVIAPRRMSLLVTYVPIAAGVATALRGALRVVRAGRRGAVPVGLGYKSFVAWRYLLDARTKVRPGTAIRIAAVAAASVAVVALRGWGGIGRTADFALFCAATVACSSVLAMQVWRVLRHVRIAAIVFLVGVGVAGIGVLGYRLAQEPRILAALVRWLSLPSAVIVHVSFWMRIAGAVLAGLALFFGSLRAYFTFFTTVPIGGVWIGTAALVMVLAVMSGFESDLRAKILGSNAHLQITREDGEFTEWRAIKAQLDRTPGVVASTPFAVSEVVVAANNQGMNVIIKGIDPNTVGRVTDLVSDLEDREAIKRLAPIATGGHDLRVPQPASGGAGSGAVVDPPPPDMPSRGDPIDFSGGALPDAGAAPTAGGHAAGHPARPDPFGGDANQVIGVDAPGAAPANPAPPTRAVVDPPPPDLLTTDEPPADYSNPDAPEAVIKVVDVPAFDSPSLSRRTQALPGILVGRELVKQTHLYAGQEVRVVSPLSDPSNPDATGTPIPFNRDYRVAGTFFTGMYEYDLKYVYVTLDSLQDFLDRGDAVDGIEVRIGNPDQTDAFVAQLSSTLGPHYRVQDWKELNRSLFSALKLEKIAMFLVLGIVILVASFSIIGNLIMVVVEKAREIALLKTLGASDIGVMQLFAIQGLMIGLFGTALGVGTGLVGCWAGKRYGLPLDPDVYYIDRLPIHVDPMSVVAAAMAGIVISIAATVYPAIVAARVRPAAGMRH